MAKLNQLLLVDLNDKSVSPRALTPASMSHALCRELVETIDIGDFELSDWQTEFIGNNLDRQYFSLEQRKVIYDLARKFRLL